MKYLFIVLTTLTLSLNAQIITTVAGNGTAGYSGDGGQATMTELYGPTNVIVDINGNLYIVDADNERIRKVDSMGIVNTIAGNGINGFSGDGGQATDAELSYPNDIAFDAIGNLYIADVWNNNIRKINTLGIITTIAGNGGAGYSGDGGQATSAELNMPTGIAFDSFGNLYIVDSFNHVIRKVNTAGIIATIVGNGTSGYSGDGGQATAAATNANNIAFDNVGNLYICDQSANRIRLVNTSGIITTIVGSGTAGFSGDGGQATAAELAYPEGIAVDGSGNLLIADRTNARIRLVNTLGIISTIVGNGTGAGTYTCCYGGDGGQATAAELNDPVGLCLDGVGSLFIADF